MTINKIVTNENIYTLKMQLDIMLTAIMLKSNNVPKYFCKSFLFRKYFKKLNRKAIKVVKPNIPVKNNLEKNSLSNELLFPLI